MRIKGNFILMYAIQAISGILMWFAAHQWGLFGLGLGLVPFFIVMPMVLFRYQVDERDMQLSHEINSYNCIGIGVIAAIIYLFFPELNWFFALMASISVIRGIIGILIFSLR